MLERPTLKNSTNLFKGRRLESLTLLRRTSVQSESSKAERAG